MKPEQELSPSALYYRARLVVQRVKRVEYLPSFHLTIFVDKEAARLRRMAREKTTKYRVAKAIFNNLGV